MSCLQWAAGEKRAISPAGQRFSLESMRWSSLGLGGAAGGGGAGSGGARSVSSEGSASASFEGGDGDAAAAEPRARGSGRETRLFPRRLLAVVERRPHPS